MDKAALSAIVNRLYPESELQNVERLTGGVSADVYRLDMKKNDKNVSVVLREHGASHSGHSASLEYDLLSALQQTKLPVPKPLYVDASRTVLPHPYLIISFVEGSSDLPGQEADTLIPAMAKLLADVHETPIHELPELPARNDPLPEIFEFLPDSQQGDAIAALLTTQQNTIYTGTPKLLHGDFWPQNILWQNNTVAAILDWEDAAIGDPLSDVACCQLELRYKFGPQAMAQFLQAYEMRYSVNTKRLRLWQLYVALAAQKYMGEWGLPAEQAAHMRDQALATAIEATEALSAR